MKIEEIKKEKGYITFDPSDKYVSALFYHETTSKRLQITLRSETIIHNNIPKEIREAIIDIGGEIEYIEKSSTRKKNMIFDIPIKILNVEKSTDIRVEVTGPNQFEVIGKLTRIRNELKKYGVKFKACRFSAEGNFLDEDK